MRQLFDRINMTVCTIRIIYFHDCEQYISVKFTSIPPQSSSSSNWSMPQHVLSSISDHAFERTPHDIYREIVCECAEIEEANNTTMTTSSIVPSILCANCQQQRDTSMHQSSTDRESTTRRTNDDDNGTTVTLQDFVKLIVTAIRESDITGRASTNTVSPTPTKLTSTDMIIDNPEEILRRKRQQNNDAAIRYRKRQRIERKIANHELHSLAIENERLNASVDQLQAEIDRLKRSILNR